MAAPASKARVPEMEPEDFKKYVEAFTTAEYDLNTGEYPAVAGFPEIGPLSNQDADKMVNQILEAKGYNALHQQKSAREKFLQEKAPNMYRTLFTKYLAGDWSTKTLGEFREILTSEEMGELEILVEKPYKPPDYIGNEEAQDITLLKLLGDNPIAVKLYEKALKEEMNSKEARNAVFLYSTKIHRGPPIAHTYDVPVGGGSGSGKSFAAMIAVKFGFMNKKFKIKEGCEDQEVDNYVVSKDGGKERELLHMRQLVVGLALSRGYKDVISDGNGPYTFGGLEKESRYDEFRRRFKKRTKIKKSIEEALKASDNHFIVLEPTTCIGKAPQSTVKGSEKKDTMVCTEIVGVEGSDIPKNAFEKQVAYGVSLRSSAPKNFKFDPNKDFKPNNRKVPWEMKPYQDNYHAGTYASLKSAYNLQKKGVPCQVVINQRVCVKLDNSTMKILTETENPKETPGVQLVDYRDFQAFKILKDNKDNDSLEKALKQLVEQADKPEEIAGQWIAAYNLDQKPAEFLDALSESRKKNKDLNLPIVVKPVKYYKTLKFSRNYPYIIRYARKILDSPVLEIPAEKSPKVPLKLRANLTIPTKSNTPAIFSNSTKNYVHSNLDSNHPVQKVAQAILPNEDKYQVRIQEVTDTQVRAEVSRIENASTVKTIYDIDISQKSENIEIQAKFTPNVATQEDFEIFLSGLPLNRQIVLSGGNEEELQRVLLAACYLDLNKGVNKTEYLSRVILAGDDANNNRLKQILASIEPKRQRLRVRDSRNSITNRYSYEPDTSKSPPTPITSDSPKQDTSRRPQRSF